ncbi:hypothetical protein BH23ACT4_BH23ACT4_07840 [soil metagenome]
MVRVCGRFPPGCRPVCHNRAVIEVATIVHIAVAAAWFGHKLLLPRDVRASVREPESGKYLVERMRRARTFGIITGILTLGTGIWLVMLTTGFAGAPITTHIAMGAVLAMFLVGFLVARPAWKRVASAIDAGDTPGAVGGANSLNSALNLESLLWILALSMMIV